jgi:hypothetical protein
MDDQHALRILTALANGTDPNTGEIYPPDSPYQSPDVVRALFAATRAIEARKAQGDIGQHVAGQHDTGQHDTGQRETRQNANPPPKASTGSASRHPAGANVGKNWSANEDQQLLAGFDAGKSLAELAQTHGRTQGGVRARLEKHGRLEPSPATRWPGRSNESARQNGQSDRGRSSPSQ